MKSNYLLIFAGFVVLIGLAIWAFDPFEPEQAFNPAQQNPEDSIEGPSNGDANQSAEHMDSSQPKTDRKNNTEALLRLAESIKPNIVRSDAASVVSDDDSGSDTPRSDFESIHPEIRRYYEGTSFLSDEQRRRYIQLDETQLLALAEAGDVGAQIRLGVRLIRTHHNVTDGMDWLIEAASHGSFEALQELRWLYQYGAGPIEKDDFAFLAWAKVGYMVGDWQALWHQGASSRVTKDESILIDALAAYYFDEINTRHVLRTGENLQVTIRPGFNYVLDQYLNYSSS